jgi:RNA polymerase sigma-70 factor (ECF subfamily)
MTTDQPSTLGIPDNLPSSSHRSSPSPAPPDAAVLGLSQSSEHPPTGRLESFGPIFTAYVDRIYRYCYARLGAREPAEDAASQTFVNALGAMAGYRGSDYGPWLFAIAHNITVDVLKSRKLALSTDNVALQDPIQDTEESALTNLLRADLQRAIKALPASQRQAVQLQLAGWSLAESAVILEKTPSAVKMLRARAMASLRNSFVQSTGPKQRTRRRRRILP